MRPARKDRRRLPRPGLRHVGRRRGRRRQRAGGGAARAGFGNLERLRPVPQRVGLGLARRYAGGGGGPRSWHRWHGGCGRDRGGGGGGGCGVAERGAAAIVGAAERAPRRPAGPGAVSPRRRAAGPPQPGPDPRRASAATPRAARILPALAGVWEAAAQGPAGCPGRPSGRRRERNRRAPVGSDALRPGARSAAGRATFCGCGGGPHLAATDVRRCPPPETRSEPVRRRAQSCPPPETRLEPVRQRCPPLQAAAANSPGQLQAAAAERAARPGTRLPLPLAH